MKDIQNIYNSNISIAFFEQCVDLENLKITDGIFKEFAFCFDEDGTHFYRYFPTKNDEVMVATTLDKNVVITENSLINQFAFDFAEQCADKIWNIAYNNFKTKFTKQREFNLNKGSLPVMVRTMPQVFYNIYFKPEKNNADLPATNKEQKVWQYIEDNVNSILLYRFKQTVKADAKHMLKDEQADLQEQLNSATNSFFNVFEKHLVIKDKTK